MTPYFNSLVLLLAFFTSSFTFAQGEANIWYFGENAGLDFNSGTPVPLTDGQLVTNEGCATIANSNGSLLFYTDGITVWDKQHNIMPNGTGLLGDPSSTQSAIIVPKPGFPDIYYIFAVTAEATSDGVTYSEVDLSLNGGNGEITNTKNVTLVAPSTEKITAIENESGTGYWVVVHGWESNDFLSFEVTSAGVNTTPIVSSAGAFHNDNGTFGLNAIGYMKISPNGQRLALAKSFNDSFVEIFDFNTTTGIISNPILIDGIFSEPEGSYGIEFSPNSNLLYVSDVASSSVSRIHQFDITFNNATDIINSDTILYEGSDFISGIQLAVDGKIYLANASQPFLDVIENPNEIGAAAGYDNRGLDLNGRLSIFGLPPFIQSFFNIAFQVENFCLGDETLFTLDPIENSTSVLWDFGDGTTTIEENPTHIYTTAGTYTVTVTVTTTNGPPLSISNEVIIYDSPVSNVVSDFVLCDDPSNDMTELFDLSTKILEILGGQSATQYDVAFYLNLSDAENDINRLPLLYTNISNSQEIFVRIYTIESTECFATTSFNLIVKETPVANEIPDIELCSGTEEINLGLFNKIILNQQPANEHTITYHTSQEDADNDTGALPLNYQIISNPQEIFVRIEKNFDDTCYNTTSFLISIGDEIIAFKPENLVECDDASQDGIEVFNLSTQDAMISNGQTGSYIISYHTSQQDASSGTNPIDNQYANTLNPETIYARIESSSSSFCFATTSFEISVENCEPFIPEGFSPNDDNVNDLFEISSLLTVFDKFELQIFNRFGTLVYKGGSEQGFWNGIPNNGLLHKDQLVPVGTYYYVLQLNDPKYPEPFTGFIYVNY